MWKEAVMAYFKVLSQHLPAATEKNENPQSRQLLFKPSFGPGTSKI
jgi:hypothetical protein